MTDDHIGPEDPMYRLYRRMDGEIVLQYFVPSRINEDFSMVGKWVSIETINESSKKE